MSRRPGQKFLADDPSQLSITDIPRFSLEELTAALTNFIYWHTRACVTRAERINRDGSFVRLRQAHWHLQDAVKRPSTAGLEKTEAQPEGLSDFELFDKCLQLRKQIPAAKLYLLRINAERRRRQRLEKAA